MAHSHSIREYPGQLSAFIALSAALGAGAGLLFAPQTGKKTRQRIKLQAVSLRDKLQRDSKDAAKQATKQTSRAASSIKTSAKPTAQAAKTPTRRATTGSTSAGKRRPSRANLTAEEIRRNGEP